MRLWVWVCDIGGWGLWWLPAGFFFFFFKWWWWLVVASHGCGCEFAWIEKKVVGLLQRKRETRIRRERKKHIGRIKKKIKMRW